MIDLKMSEAWICPNYRKTEL